VKLQILIQGKWWRFKSRRWR